MSRLKRRHFLQFAGSTLAALGLSRLDLQRVGDRYARVLAQPTPRKLALLVGINQYPNSFRFTQLKGCVTDVALQRELLIHRFGFNPNDILTLTDETAQKPTRANILTAFEVHLIKQARPGDVVVFHFSGHGSRVLDPQPLHPDDLSSTFVPADASADVEVVNDLMGQTLFLLMSALQTERVTVVLDSCFSGGGTRGNVRLRAAEGGRHLRPGEVELAYQQRWLEQLSIDRDQFVRLRSIGVAKGLVIASAQRDQTATDARFNGFYAGAFTYLLTQLLWQETPTVDGAIARVTRSIRQHSHQVPLVEVKVGSQSNQESLYWIDNAPIAAAEAVITQVEGDRATVWLGGIDSESLAAFDAGAVFTVVGTSVREAGAVTLLSRQGLRGTVQLPTPVPSNTLLREAARVIPGDFRLRVGLDPSLGAETARAQEHLAGLNRVEAVPPQSGEVPYTGAVQYILGQMTPAYRQALQRRGISELAKPGSIGLFSQSLDAVIPGSFSATEETVTAAIDRLKPKLTALVAARLLKLTLNANSSQLRLTASMNIEGQADQLIAVAFTARGPAISGGTNQPLSQELPLDAPFQFRVTNHESEALYLSILVVDPTGTIVVLFPNRWGAAVEVTRLEAKQTLLIPDPANDDFQFLTQERVDALPPT